jgi:hypothetical protein
MSMKIWYAVSGRGQGNVYTSCPVRNEHFKIWEGHIEGCISSVVCLLSVNGELELPNLSWDNNPVELELSVNVL